MSEFPATLLRHTTMTTIPQATEAVKTLRPFIGREQLAFIGELCRGEEGEWFKAKLVELASVVTTMPKTGESDGKGKDALVYLHYFTGGCDWYILEKDMGCEGEPNNQEQAFGYANIGDDYNAEFGYIGLPEILAFGAELDLHWTPKAVGEFVK